VTPRAVRALTQRRHAHGGKRAPALGQVVPLLVTRAGFTDSDALQIYRALIGFLHGHILNELQEIVERPRKPRPTSPGPTPAARSANSPSCASLVFASASACLASFRARRSTKRVHLATGTMQVTAIGMFAGGVGFAIAPPTLATLVIVVGGLSRRPIAVDDQIVIHDVLDLTITIDHNVVDGAPATRFGAELRRLMESAAALAPKHPPKAA
jgi:hypothetical protein